MSRPFQFSPHPLLLPRTDILFPQMKPRMRRLVFALVLALCVIHLPASCQQETTAAAPGHYLLAWTGDAAKKGNDFLAVIDADPSSPSYGRLVTTLATDQQTKLVHHTEYVMPASGLLFANDHEG